MKSTALALSFSLLAGSAALSAQSPNFSSSLVAAENATDGSAVQLPPRPKIAPATIAPLSRVALSAGVSDDGVNLQLATNIGKHFNARTIGNVFNYNVNNISTNGFNVDAKLNLATAGESLDYYPWANHGFRLSPGVRIYNKDSASAIFTVASGTSFTLDDTTYYASSANPVQGTGTFGLHTQNPAFTMTTGWGNMIPRKGGHLSFPFEAGVALIGSPTVNVALTSGQVCDANGLNCVNVATDSSVQSNLQAQVAKYKSDLDPLKTYPIVSFGVAYSFRVRGASAAR
jgi:hypothetical protein